MICCRFYKETYVDGKELSMRKQQGNILLHEEASAKDIYLKRPFKYKLMETVLYIIVLFGVFSWFPGNSTAALVAATIAAVVIVGFSPMIYKALLHPTYKLSRTHLVIRIGNKEDSVPLHELQRDGVWKPTYRANGKKYHVMASHKFLGELDNQIARAQKRGK
jgi:hypothetical protein